MKVIVLFIVFLALIGEYFYSRYSLSENDLKVLELQIASLNQNISCDSIADCEALPTGDKPCGGPDKYIVVSKKNDTRNELRIAIQRYTDLDRKIDTASGSAGTCDVVIEPKLECLENICTRQN